MKNRKQEMKFEPDMPDVPNFRLADEGVIFRIHAKPIKFGPYKDMTEARKAFDELKKKLEDRDENTNEEEITIEKLTEIVAHLHRFCLTYIMVPSFVHETDLCRRLLNDRDLLSRFTKDL